MREHRVDRGLTMIELIVVIVLMGIVATVLMVATSAILCNEGATNTRADDARTLHGLSTWLSRDAAATPPGNFDLSAAATTNCTSGDPGINLVRMDWGEDTSVVVNYVASYRFVDRGGGDFRIERHTCSGTGAGPYPNGTVLNLTGSLSATPPNVTPAQNLSLETIAVSIEAFSSKGDPIFADGGSRNPAETLPTTTTTTLPPPPCTLSSVTVAPSPTTNQGPGISPLSTDVTVTITVAGSCGTITLRYDRGDGAGLQIEAVTGAFPNHTVVLESDVAEPWSDATHTLTVFDDANALTPTVDVVVN